MSIQKLPFLLASVFLIIISTSSSSHPQSKPSEIMDRQRRVKSEPSRAYVDWPKRDVRLIITPDEQRAYEKLATDEEREQFIAHFWDLRDPDPDTEENEYKEQYYERMAYANEHFTSGKPGWLTDRGKIFIKFGKPDEIESHAMGGSYERASYEGSGSTTTYPFEKWFYRYIPGVGSGIEIEFVDPTGSGEFRLARSLDEKEIQIGGLHRTETANYRREQDSPFAVSAMHLALDRAPEIQRNSLDGALMSSPAIDDNSLSFDISPAYFRQSDNRVLTAFTIQIDNRELVFENSGGLHTARVNIVGRITQVAGRRVGAFEDSVTTSATAAELTDAKERKSAYAKALILQPGRYRVDVRVRDIVSGAEGIKHYGFEVPRFTDDKLAVSSIVLAAKLESIDGQPAVSSFVIGRNRVIPNLTRIYHRGQPVGVYLQVYNAGIDQTTLRPSIDVEYVLSQDGKEFGKQVEDWSSMSDAGQRLTLARLVETRTLAPGDYILTIRIRDGVSGQTLSPAAKFTVVP